MVCGPGNSICDKIAESDDVPSLCIGKCYFDPSTEKEEQPSEFYHPKFGCVKDCFAFGLYYPYELVKLNLAEDNEANTVFLKCSSHDDCTVKFKD